MSTLIYPVIRLKLLLNSGQGHDLSGANPGKTAQGKNPGWMGCQSIAGHKVSL